MKVGIIGGGGIGKTTLSEIVAKCDLPIVLSPFMEKEETDFGEIVRFDNKEVVELSKILNEEITLKNKNSYRLLRNGGSKYHK